MTMKVKEGEPQIEGQTDGEAPQAEPEVKIDETAGLKERLSVLEAQNKELQAKVSTTAQAKVTSSGLRALPESHREKLAETYGMPFEQIVASVEANERQELERGISETRATSNVREAIEAACESDPQVTKLKGHIREFLADIPVSDKADPDKLKNWMRKAVSYARGQAGVAKPAGQVNKVSIEKTPGPDDEPTFEKEAPESGRVNFEDGNHITLEKMIPDDKRKEMKHPTRDNALRISCDFDKAPRFR